MGLGSQMAWVLGTLALFVGLGALYMIADVNRRVEVQLQRFRATQIKALESSIAGLANEIENLEHKFDTDDDLKESLDKLRTEIAAEIGEINDKLAAREKALSDPS
jgi:DNA anti-recombination protein RmuC